MPFESISASPERQRALICIVAAALSALSQATLLGIFTSLVVVDLAKTSLRVPVLTAIVFCALVTLVMLAVVAGAIQPAKKWKTTLLEPMLLLLSVALSLATSILSIYILVKTWSYYRFNKSSISRSLTASLVVVGLTFWSFNLVTQLITYALLSPPVSCIRREPEEINTIGYRYPSSPRKRFSVSFRTHVSPATPEKAHSTDPYSPSSASLRSLKSSRHGSISQVFAPLGSKTRLLISQSLPGHSDSQLTKREPSLEIACRGETPEPAPPMAVYELSSSPPLVKHPSPLTRLETIPGSRPVSPAKPLDGPYPSHEEPPEMLPLPESPTLSRPQSPIHDLPFPPMIGEVAFQSHIHPLFRSGSPGPHPVTSPGTVVTAAPHAGQVVPTDMWRQRSAQNSRSGTPDLSPQDNPMPQWRRRSEQSSRSATPDTQSHSESMRRQRSAHDSRAASPEQLLTAPKKWSGCRTPTPDMHSHSDADRRKQHGALKRQDTVASNRTVSSEVTDGMPNFSRPGVASRNELRATNMI